MQLKKLLEKWGLTSLKIKAACWERRDEDETPLAKPRRAPTVARPAKRPPPAGLK